MHTSKFTLALPLLALLFPALALAGTKSYTAPGTYTFTVPEYTGSLTVTLLGGGGGGGGGQGGGEPENGGTGIGSPGGDGGNGGNVSFGSVTANGGKGGCGGGSYSSASVCSGSSYSPWGMGGGDNGRNVVSAGGAAGGYICQHCVSAGWSAPSGSYGENGGKTIRTYGAGELTPGSTVTVFVGKGSESMLGLIGGSGISANGGRGGAGGGGGGKGDDIRPGSAGRQSSFGNTVVARGGSGGNVSTYTASPGAPGTASGGDTNTTGGGASGGSGGTLARAATGGNGGMSVKTYQAGALTSPITVVVGAGGAGGATVNPSYSGGNGSSGSVVITGGANSCNPPPTLSCSVTFDQNPLTGSATTMRWTSTGAELFYINQVGWVGASGSAQVSSPGDYSGTVSGTGGVNSQTYSTPGTYTAPRAGEVTITVIGGGGGGGGDSVNPANIRG